jgi:hypothetical protein
MIGYLYPGWGCTGGMFGYPAMIFLGAEKRLQQANVSTSSLLFFLFIERALRLARDINLFVPARSLITLSRIRSCRSCAMHA